jgi:hypothetical protein
MSQFVRCETCRREAAVGPRGDDSEDPDWVYLLEGWRKRDFCSWPCVADYVTARMLIPRSDPGQD